MLSGEDGRRVVDTRFPILTGFGVFAVKSLNLKMSHTYIYIYVYNMKNVGV